VSEGELWKNQRRLIQPAFHRNAITALGKVITTANVELLRAWKGAAIRNESVNVTVDISLMVLKVVLASILGDDYDEVGPEFNVLSDEAGRNLAFAQKFRSLGQIIQRTAVRRRKQNMVAPDILGMLMEARDRDTGQPMQDSQLVKEIMTLIVAGHETTASTLNWTWYLLSQNPDVEQKLDAELKNLDGSKLPDLDTLSQFPYTRQIIDEALRMYPAGWLMTRRALADDQLGDYFVPAGTEVYVPPYFIQRNPKLWDDPDRFKPDRFEGGKSESRHRLAMLPFSVGPRNCVGEVFARIEMQVHLMMVAKPLRLRYVEERPPELDIGVNLRSKHDFVMRPEIKAC